MHDGSNGISRRAFLRMSGMFAGAAVLAACTAAPPAAPAGEQGAADAPAADTGSLEMYTRLTNNDQLAALSTRYAEEHNGSQLTVSAFDGRDMLTKLTT
jgi:ABC-type glycerol-3-phosphate transport system substrate-binding protein